MACSMPDMYIILNIMHKKLRGWSLAKNADPSLFLVLHTLKILLLKNIFIFTKMPLVFLKKNVVS